jgi:hypothetical protein
LLGVAGSFRSTVDQAISWLGDALGNLIDWLGSAVTNSADSLDGALGWLAEALGTAAIWLFDAVVWLGAAHEPVGEILAFLWPPVVAAVLLIALLRSVRWLLLIWRARTPRVQISTFAWTASEDGAREATWVTSLFREQLAALRLDALDPLPERAPGAPLVEIVEGVGQGVGRGLEIGKAVGRLFRTVWPDSAYEVWGTLRPREDGGGRVSVQLVDRRGGNRTLLNVALEEAEWEDGAREAAMAVAGALYPRVRKRDRGPWTMWTQTVPRGLMADYHAAREDEAANRLEHALDRYHAALDQDPLNPNLRLKIAMLLERLELDLDAWVTYEAIVDESDRRAWRGPDRRVYLLAHYRLAILLGNARVAEQWVKNDSLPEDQETKRDCERRKLREELINSLETHLLQAERRFDTPTTGLVTASSASLLSMLREAGGEAKDAKTTLKLFKAPAEETKDQRDARRREIDAVLQVLCLWHLEELDAWLRVRPPGHPRQWKDWWVHRPRVRRWMRRRQFSRSTVRISKLLIRIRIGASLERRYGEPPDPKPNEIPGIRKAHMTLSKRWPFPAAGRWRRVTHFIAPRRRWANRRDDAWQLHYNAACAVASVLRGDSVLSRATSEPEHGDALPSEATTAKVIDQAIAELEEYAYRAGSRRVAAQADWLAIDDPDLSGLRSEPKFKLWASHHLPRGLPPTEAYRKSDVKRFTVRVVHEGARAFAESWRERADTPDASAAEIANWWRNERLAWETLQNSCREHLSWSERLNGLKALQAWLAAAGQPELIDFAHEPRGDTTTAGTLKDEVFEALIELVGDRPPPAGNDGSRLQPEKPTVLPWVHGRAKQVRTAYENGETQADARGSLLADIERREALRAFRIWTWLADALAAELYGRGAESETRSLRDRLDRIHKNLPAD